jgi:hypothetical protein
VLAAQLVEQRVGRLESVSRREAHGSQSVTDRLERVVVHPENPAEEFGVLLGSAVRLDESFAEAVQGTAGYWQLHGSESYRYQQSGYFALRRGSRGLGGVRGSIGG